jgi:predicted dehydrogenase
MLRLALIGCPDDPAPLARIAPRLRGQFVAAADRDTWRAWAAAAALGAEVVSDTLDALLAEHAGAFDAVVLRGPGRFADPLCESAAAAGKHVLVEAPLARDAGAAAEAVAACERAGVRLMVAEPARFLPAVRAVKASLGAGQLGEPGLVRVHRWAPAGPPDEQALPLTSEIDLTCWLFDQFPRAVYAVGRRRNYGPREGPDYLQIHLGFAGGGMALLDVARTLPPGDGYFSLTLIGSAGAAYADDHHNAQLLFGRGPPAALFPGPGDLPLLAQLEEFVSAVEEGREPCGTGAEGVRALHVAEVAALSRERGQALVWDEVG